MEYHRRVVGRFLAIAAIAVAGAIAWPAAAQSPSAPAAAARVQTPEEALTQDAGEYARQFAVSRDEALSRLRAQQESVAITDRLQEQYRDRVAGIAIQHRPDYRIIVNLTGTQPVAAQRARLGGRTVPIEFRTGARASRERVIWAITYHQAKIRAALSAPPAMGLDPRTGELVVIVSKANAASLGRDALQAKFEALTGVPVQIRLIERTDVNLDVDGGSRIEGVSPDNGKRYLCTTGFAVTDGRRSGVTTAAHCLNALTYYGPQREAAELEFVGEWGWGYHDVQVHLSKQPLRPLFFADNGRTVARPVTGLRGRTSTRAGDFVCHRGETTGYSCAEVELIDFAPAGDLCGGACLPTWVTVAGPGCKGGDSGGPVFSGTIALGVLKGGSYRRDGSCAFYFYMSTDYLPAGWSLMTSLAHGGGVTAAR